MTLHNKLQNLLLKAGLSEIEAVIYIELLKSPSQNTWQLVQRTGLSKSSVYRAVSKLKELKMVETKKGEPIKALSLKFFVSELESEERKTGKLAYQIRQIAPFLSAPDESIEEFEQYYTPEQIQEAYLFMAEQKYDNNLDFGDFENFIPKIGGMDAAFRFRNNRVKHARNFAICTTFGPNTANFCTKEAESKYKNKIKLLKSDFINKFIIFSDNSDYVLFNEFEDEENMSSVLVKSRLIADVQRAQFSTISQSLGK